MGKYSGLPGEYYYGKKVYANKAVKSAQAKGYHTRLTKWGNVWLLKVY